MNDRSRWRSHAGPAALLSVFVILIQMSPAQQALADGPQDDALLWRWSLTPGDLRDGAFPAQAGSMKAAPVGTATFTEAAVAAARFGADKKVLQRLDVTDDITTLKLPEQDITLEAWVMVDKATEWGGLISLLQDNGDYEKGWVLGYNGDRFCIALASKKVNRLTYLKASSPFQLGCWYHVVGTYDGRLLSIYIDGELSARTTQQSGPIAYPPKTFFTVGAYRDDNETYPLEGKLEQVSVWGRSLTAEQVAARFEERKAKLPGILAPLPEATDWPTYMRDGLRSGRSTESLALPLKLAWVHQPRHAPEPAWPPPAKQDFWNKKFNIQPRVIFDRSFACVTVGDRIYFGSSSDHQVHCLDALTGRELWTFFTEGPVRLAPTVHEGLVLAGSDDGSLYALDAETGALKWKKRIAPQDRRIPGNEHIITPHPVRSGVLINDGKAFAAAGLFPTEGVYQITFDPKTSEVISNQTLTVSAQGYMQRRSGQLHIATGRDLAGSVSTPLGGGTKDYPHVMMPTHQSYPFAQIAAGDLRIGGGENKVGIWREGETKERWTAPVEGNVYSLALARGRLLVSTDSGRIYCFVSGKAAAAVSEPFMVTAPASVAPQSKGPVRSGDIETGDAFLASLVATRLKSAGIEKGFGLLLGSGSGELLYELTQRTGLRWVGVEPDEAKANASRRMLDAAGVYGPRAVVHQVSLESLPYTDYMFNAVVGFGEQPTIARSVDPKDEKQLAAQEFFRVLRPIDGVAILGLTDKHVIHRGPLPGAGEWTHFYANPANTVCSDDQYVKGAMLVQWFGPPGPRDLIDRHHRTVAPLSKGGRLFIPGDDRVYCVDAYNGTMLWTLEAPNSKRVVAFRDSSNMAVSEDLLYLSAADACMAIDVRTGEVKRTMRLPSSSSEPGVQQPHEWAYTATVDDLLLGTAVKSGGLRRVQSRDVAGTISYWDFVPIVGSDYLVVMDRKTGDERWRYTGSDGLIINATLSIANDTVYFVQSTNGETLKAPFGQAKLNDLVGKGAQLVALDLKTGKQRWRKPVDLKVQHNVFALVADGLLIVAGSRNSGQDRKSDKVLYDLHVFNADSGEPVWNTTQNQGTGIGGDHGEQDHHPVVVGGTLYAEPYAYDLRTGKPDARFAWNKAHRRGCGTISASASTFFFRNATACMFDLAGNKLEQVSAVSRPGCYINLIPAGGLLLAPEASSGCSCNFAVQTSQAFLPVKGGATSSGGPVKVEQQGR
ncbi:MAG: PQQ-binding-like beta-propeller repeat protein [Phycisphaeraceae bacterium]